MDQFVVAREDDVLFLRWAPGACITHEMAVEAATALRHLSQGRILPLVVLMRGIDGVTLTTRLGMNSYQGFSVVSLVGDGPVDEVLAGFAHGALTTTRYFSEEDLARSWVEGFLPSSADGSPA